jgi:hypothetical protein
VIGRRRAPGSGAQVPLHRARLGSWTPDQLKARLASVVDGLVARDGEASPLAVVMELLSGEMPTFLVFGRMGHLDPPRPDGKVAFAVLEQKSEDVGVGDALRRAVRSWIRPEPSPRRSRP